MATINRLDYGNDLLNEKTNFFWDYFDYYISNAGQLWDFELENPLSLVRKIVFQLESNIFLAHNYVPVYLERIAKYGKAYLNIFPGYSDVQQHLDGFNNIIPPKSKQLPEFRKQWLINNQSQLLKDFGLFTNKLEQSMLVNSVNSLIDYFKCEKSLKQLKEAIVFHTKIIATECLFCHKERKEAKKMFSQIFARDYRSYPYPKGINTLEEKRKYFDPSNFEKTYKAIIDFIYVPTDIKYIICKIDTLLFSKNDFFEFGGVTFFSINNKKAKAILKYLNESKSKSILINKAYSKRNYGLAIVEVNPQDIESAIKFSIKKVDRSLYYLNRTLNTVHIADPKNFLFTHDFTWFGYKLSPTPKPGNLDKDEISRLNDNAYFFLKDKEYFSKEAFLQHEMEFIQARKSGDMYGLWRYLEILLFDKTKEKNKIKRTIANALLLTEKPFYIKISHQYIRAILRDSTPEQLGVSLEQQEKYFAPNCKLTGLLDVNSIFLKDAYLQSNRRFTINTRIEISNYYYNILNEAYEQRNSIAHSGISLEQSLSKLEFTLNLVVTRFRWVIFDYMRKYPTATLAQIFDHIKSDFSKLGLP